MRKKNIPVVVVVYQTKLRLVLLVYLTVTVTVTLALSDLRPLMTRKLLGGVVSVVRAITGMITTSVVLFRR